MGWPVSTAVELATARTMASRVGLATFDLAAGRLVVFMWVIIHLGHFGERKERRKRGGVRVIYDEVTQAGQIWLLAIYAKNRQENLPARVIRLIKDHRVKS
jgi:hypothetical protein